MSITVVIPYFNEEDFLPATLASLQKQTLRPFTIILVDNASTDRTEARARAVMSQTPDIETVYLSETHPGKLLALATGIAAVKTDYVATCDADTFYPPAYLEHCVQLFESGGAETVAVMACDLYSAPTSMSGRFQRAKIAAVATLLHRQCHAGGYAQAFRTRTLRAVGGFDPSIWPYTLEDHEIVHRLLKRGKIRYDAKHWCMPSVRRSDRSSVTWTLAERILYHIVPFGAKDWLFYKFFAQRFHRRGMSFIKLREKNWS